jgi:hypothetical protein
MKAEAKGCNRAKVKDECPKTFREQASAVDAERASRSPKCHVERSRDISYYSGWK